MRRLLLVITLPLMFAELYADGPQWVTDFETAKAMARKENKSLLVNFTGSDWCGWCKKLDREVFRKDTFKDFAKSNLVLVKVDFPRYKALSRAEQMKNEKLLRKYGVTGFPSILLISSGEKVLLRTGYRRGGPDSYVRYLKSYLP